MHSICYYMRAEAAMGKPPPPIPGGNRKLTESQYRRYTMAYSLEVDSKSPFFEIYATSMLVSLGKTMRSLPRDSPEYEDLYNKYEKLDEMLTSLKPRYPAREDF
jgi:hypothetical protein